MYVLRREELVPFPRAVIESLFYLRDELRKRMEHFAQADGVELDTFITSILSQRIAVADADSYIQRRASRGSSKRMLDILSKTPEVEPAENDRIKVAQPQR